MPIEERKLGHKRIASEPSENNAIGPRWRQYESISTRAMQKQTTKRLYQSNEKKKTNVLRKVSGQPGQFTSKKWRAKHRARSQSLR